MLANVSLICFDFLDSFAEKNHFPDALRPFMLSLATVAHQLDSLDENFFSHVRKILPYNNITLKKLVSRLMKNDRMAVLDGSIEGLYRTLKESVELEMKDVDLVALKAAMPVPEASLEVKIERMKRSC
jgi:hypothetical protein